MLLLPRLDADALVPEGALQVPAGRVPLRAARRGEPAARQARARVRARRHRRLRRRTATSTSSSSTRRRRPTTSSIRITVANRGPGGGAARTCCRRSGSATPGRGAARARATGRKPRDRARTGDGALVAEHASLGRFRLDRRAVEPDGAAELLFTENETNAQRLFGAPNATPYVKDAFHELRRPRPHGRGEPERTRHQGGRALPCSTCPPGGEVVVRLRLCAPRRGAAASLRSAPSSTRRSRAPDARPTRSTPRTLPPSSADEERARRAPGLRGAALVEAVLPLRRQGLARGRPGAAAAAAEAPRAAATRDWTHLYNRDVISMPDKWEYPWYAAWDLAFHMIPFARDRPEFAKEQLVLFLREWYMHPNGQIPAYEFAFGDVNPPVHAWACWRVYKMTGRARRARPRLPRARLPEAALNFTWWVNRKDADGKQPLRRRLPRARQHRRLRPLAAAARPAATSSRPTARRGWRSTARRCSRWRWSSRSEDPAYEDMASKFFEHFVAIADAMNTLGGTGLWDEEDGFYYDQLHVRRPARSRCGPLDGRAHPAVRGRGARGRRHRRSCPGSASACSWFLENRQDLARHISYMAAAERRRGTAHRLLAIPSRERLERVLRYMLDENEFLSPYGIRSLSRVHRDQPVRASRATGRSTASTYDPGESTTGLFGGNSNWRGPIWFPVNYLLVEALRALPPLLRRRAAGRVPDRLGHAA